MKKISLLLFLSLFYLGCANNSVNNKNLSTYAIKSNVIENQTTQKEIQDIFGEPYSINTNNQGNVVWIYHDITVNSPGYNSFSASFTAGKGGHSKGNHNPRYKWVIIFNSDGIVVNSDVRTLY